MTALTAHHLRGLEEIAKGFQQINVQDQVWKSTEYKPCFCLLPLALTFYLIKFPPEKCAMVKRPRTPIPYRGNPSIYLIQVSPLKHAQGSYQPENHPAITPSVLNTSAACAVFYHRTSPAQHFLSITQGVLGAFKALCDFGNHYYLGVFSHCSPSRL